MTSLVEIPLSLWWLNAFKHKYVYKHSRNICMLINRQSEKEIAINSLELQNPSVVIVISYMHICTYIFLYYKNEFGNFSAGWLLGEMSVVYLQYNVEFWKTLG